MEKQWKVDMIFPVQSVGKEWGFSEPVSWDCSEVNADRRLTLNSSTLPFLLLYQFISKKKVEKSFQPPRGCCSGCLNLF